MNFIDLRSDTVTRPSAAMRDAIANAVVGDDVFNDDPTVARLERMTAELLGKEAGLFVPTGTMGNQVSIKTLSNPGDEIICDEGCHIFNYEAAAGAVVAGLLFHVVRGVRGIITAADIAPLIRPGDSALAPHQHHRARKYAQSCRRNRVSHRSHAINSPTRR